MNIPENDPALKTWVDVPAASDFPIQNLPFGIFSTRDRAPRPGVRIGDHVVDLHVLADRGYLDDLGLERHAFTKAGTFDGIIAHGKGAVRALRARVSHLLREGTPTLRKDHQLRNEVLLPIAECTMHLPVTVGDYTDFYSSRQHAYNVGVMFRDPANALLPNWLHLPVGYHGRASSIVPSGTPIHRPCGQFKPAADAAPQFGPTRQLDFELEVAFITFAGKPLGQRITTAEAEDRIFGLVLFNDWSARDIQAWEYVPLGPFLGKNFASSMSPWVVTLDALEPFRVPGPVQDPAVLPYLQCTGDRHFDIALEVGIANSAGLETTVCTSNHRHLHWNMAQQLAHHTVNGCNVRAGDLMASGTISGDTPGSFGSMLELSWKGTRPVPLKDGTVRTFIADGDTVIMRGHAERNGVRVGFGEVRGTVLPALP